MVSLRIPPSGRLMVMRVATALFLGLALGGCEGEGPASGQVVTPELEACVREKEAQAIAAGRVEREGPGAVNDWALRQCAIAPPERTRVPIEADNLREVESTRPIPPGAR
jgi:hypothetical protein